MAPTVHLTDDSSGIAIAKSGAPEPGPQMLEWLARETRDAWSYDCDGVFNIYFRFADADDAARFKVCWSG